MSAGIINAAAISSAKSNRRVIASPLDLDFEELLCIVFKDHFLFGSAEKLEPFDDMPSFLQPFPCLRIFDGADAGAFGPEQASICTNRFEKQSQCVSGIENRVVIEVAHLVRESRTAASQ